MFKNVSKKTKIVIIVVCVFTLFAVLGITYAYFSAGGISGNSTTNVVEIETARHEQLILRYEENGGEINAFVNLPDETKGSVVTEIMKFNIENAGSVSEDIAINWLEINNGFCQYANGQTCTNDENDTYVGDELTYTLYNCTAEEYATVTEANVATTCDALGVANTRTPLTGDISYLSSIEKITIPDNSITYYVLAFNVENTEEVQNYQQNRTFSGRLWVDIYSEDRLVVEGVVYDGEGHPLPNVVVELHSDPMTTTTDVKGYYRFEDVPYGDHQVKVVGQNETQVTKYVSFVKSNIQSISENVIRSDAKVLNVDITVEDPTLDVKFSPGVTLNVTNGTTDENKLIYLGESVSSQITANEDYVLPNATINCPPGITFMYGDTGLFTVTKATVDGTCVITLPLDQKELTYNCTENGGSCSNNVVNQYITLDVDLTKQGTKAGWDFVGWNTNPTATTALETYKMPKNAATLYAIYSKTSTATFNVGTGATEISESSKSCTVYNKQTECTITAPNITSAPGYTGTKFFNTANNSSSGTIEGATITLTESIVYYGQTLDIIAPIVTFSSNDNATYSKTANVVVTISDIGSLVSQGQSIKYRWQTENTCSTVESDYTLTATLSNVGASAASATATVTADDISGLNYLCIYSGIKDNAVPSNNESVITKTTGTFALDNTGPTINSIDSNVKDNNIYMEVNATDNNVGMTNATYYYAITDGVTCEGLTYTPSSDNNFTFTSITTEDTYLICSYVKDNLTNIGEKSSKSVEVIFVTIGTDSLGFDTTSALGYKMLTDTNVNKVTTAATLTKGASPVTSTNVVAENGIYRTSDNDGFTYYYRGGEGCSTLGTTLTTYTTAATCMAANGVWATANEGSTYACYTNGTPNTCTTNGGTWSYLNNNVSFAGFNWKIVRINGDRSIRLVLDGETNTVKKTGLSDFAGSKSAFNTSALSNAGAPNSTNAPTAVDYASYIGGSLESALNTFYATYLTTFASKLADSKFCSDIAWGDNAGTTWFFESGNNIWSTAWAPGVGTSSLICPTASTYTVSGNTGIRLINPIATLSADEVILAGGRGFTYNSQYYLNNPETVTDIYWTMSPLSWDYDGYVSNVSVTAGGRVAVDDVNDPNAVRPVINLKHNAVVASGNGTKATPYVIE